MKALALLTSGRARTRHAIRDSDHATPNTDGAIDQGLHVVGVPGNEAAWARFGARSLDADARQASSASSGLRPPTTVVPHRKES